MNPGFCMHKRNSAGNLHLSIFGEFNGMCAWELLKHIKCREAGSGRVFIDTIGLGKITPDGVALFKHHMTQTKIPSDWLYLKGKNGFQIAPNGNRVLILNKCGSRKGFHAKEIDRPSLPILKEKFKTIDNTRRSK